MSRPEILHLRILLASTSPRRKELLEQMGLEVRVQKVPVDEEYPSDLTVWEVAEFLAEKKSKASLPFRQAGEIILTGDSVVICNDQILEKPKDRHEARTMLKLLSGRSHTVVTGVCLTNGATQRLFSDHCIVHFQPLNAREIDYYVTQYQPYDKAGSYGIQEWIGWCKVHRIEGSFATVMGLPTHRVYEELTNYFTPASI